jgi:hypothetical protein
MMRLGLVEAIRPAEPGATRSDPAVLATVTGGPAVHRTVLDD